MKYRILIILIIVFYGSLSYGQKTYNMVGFELQLQPLMQQMFTSQDDNKRFAANEEFISLMEEALEYEKSFDYSFDKLDKIKILYSEDKRFRIITWAIVNEQGSWENYGFIQAKDSEGNYVVSRLFDKSDDIFSPEEEKLNDSTWFGAVYYTLITTKNDKHTYYTLLGWDGNTIYSQRKIIEPITIKSNGRPVFGQNIFYKDKNRVRMIFEYSTDANLTLKYGEQYYEITTNQKAKSTLFHKAKPFEKQSSVLKKQKMIFYDILEPQNSVMQGLSLYYIPSGNMMGLYFENGKWKSLKYNVQPRNKPSKQDAATPDNYDFTPRQASSKSLFPNQ